MNYRIKPEDRDALARIAGDIAGNIIAGVDPETQRLPLDLPREMIAPHAVDLAVQIYEEIDWRLKENEEANRED